ncbi:MATE family efflux transporter [Anditalea andensis]|uniref:Flippase n=1 Tax=Anditalea andensis TaxID=1048983 RepID=A0A074KU90_9BACT|nr:flippase [Anditalea andensis]KEO71835.1 flippase [Anditalea andensis]
MQASNRVALNTAILYARMVITMGITLYSTRLVLDALGDTDYGIFNLIAGIIIMLSFLNSAMATSTQRYLSFHQGQNDLEMQKKVFSNSLALHIMIGIVIVLGLEVGGLFFFDGFLNIPPERVIAAKTIYHFMSLTVFFTVVAVPFSGSLIANENMLWVAIVNIIEALLKLAIAIYVLYISGDRLIYFGFLTAGISLVSFFLYALYCLKRYPECDLSKVFTIDKPLLKDLSSFAGWNLFGALCIVSRNQGTAIILNLFYGVIINSAYGIANQVSAQLSFFSATLLRALNPQIMKSEGANDRQRMLRLSMMASKFGFFLMALFAIPCIFEMQVILELWLINIPDYTILFCSLMLVSAMANQLTVGLQSAAQATGKIKFYQSLVGTILLLNLPLAYLVLNQGFPPHWVIYTFILIEIVASTARLFFLRILAGLDIILYIQRVFIKEIIPVSVSVFTCWIIVNYLNFPFRFLLTGISSGIVFLLLIYFTGLCLDEKVLVDQLMNKARTRLKIKNQYA